MCTVVRAKLYLSPAGTAVNLQRLVLPACVPNRVFGEGFLLKSCWLVRSLAGGDATLSAIVTYADYPVPPFPRTNLAAGEPIWIFTLS